MKKLCTAVLLVLFISSCSSLTPKPHVLYERPDLNVKASKIIIFPTTDFNGKSSAGSKSIDLSINSSWAVIYGADKVIPAGFAIEKISSTLGNNFYQEFISALDNVSAVEQIAKNKTAKKFITKVTNKFGKFQFALAIISGGEAEYNAGQKIYLHVGLFNTSNLTWRLITKIETQKTPIGNWKVASQAMIHNSFDAIKKMTTTSESE